MVGDTLPPDADVANPALLFHVYDAAVGVQLLVSVVDPPQLMLVGDALSVQVGGWLTVTVADTTAPVPTALVPVAALAASLVGDTLPPDANDPNPALLLHVYDAAVGVQLVANVVDPPRLMLVGDALNVQVGGWFTVTVADAPVPAALVPVTVKVAVDVGDTLPLEADDANPALLLHVSDVPAGLQLAISVLDRPRLIVVGEAASEPVGDWFIVTVTLAGLPAHPAGSHAPQSRSSSQSGSPCPR